MPHAANLLLKALTNFARLSRTQAMLIPTVFSRGMLSCHGACSWSFHDPVQMNNLHDNKAANVWLKAEEGILKVVIRWRLLIIWLFSIQYNTIHWCIVLSSVLVKWYKKFYNFPMKTQEHSLVTPVCFYLLLCIIWFQTEYQKMDWTQHLIWYLQCWAKKSVHFKTNKMRKDRLM